jgi:endoglucanase
VGAFIVLEALRRIAAQKPDATVFAVASSQEEIGMRGIAPCAYSLDPQVGIAVDVGQATDVPGADASGMGFGECTLGGGPQILRGPNTTPWLFALGECVAEEHHIPIQREVYGGATPTDAGAMQVSREGVMTCLIDVPNRYLHTPCEMVDLVDVEHTIELIVRVVKRLDTAGLDRLA